MWVKLTEPDGEGFPRHVTSEDLCDLKHLVDQAMKAVEAEERRIERLHGGRD